LKRAKVRWWCFATAGRNYPIPGGIKSGNCCCGYHVVAPDRRGFGRTSAPANIGAYSIFDHVGDTVALVAALIAGLIGAKRVADMERVLPNLKQKLIIDGAGIGSSRNAPTRSTRP